MIAMTFGLAVLFVAAPTVVQADDSSAPAKTDSPAAPQPGSAATTPPQIDPAIMAAMAQAAKLLAPSLGDASAQTAGKISPVPDPALTAAMMQAAKILTQSLADPATLAALQKQADALTQTAGQDGKDLVRDNAPKVEGDDSRQAAQAEITEAQKMADAALANAAQAASAATTTTAGGDSLSTANQAVAGHASLNGLVDSVQSLGPDPSDKNHHSLDSLF
jgi:hypothetical protein